LMHRDCGFLTGSGYKACWRPLSCTNL
jgi:hypothetical protein